MLIFAFYFLNMKKLTQFLATGFFLVFALNIKSQDTSILKSFINENDIAIRSVQKYSINLSDPSADSNVKELLKLQVYSVKLFNENIKKSADLALTIREKCTVFLKANSKGSLEFLEFTDKERAYFSSNSPASAEKINLSAKEIQKIESLDTKDPHLFDNIETRIK